MRLLDFRLNSRKLKLKKRKTRVELTRLKSFEVLVNLIGSKQDVWQHDSGKGPFFHFENSKVLKDTTIDLSKGKGKWQEEVRGKQ